MNKPKTALYPYPLEVSEEMMDTIIASMPEHLFGPIRAVVLLNSPDELTEAQHEEVLTILEAHLGGRPKDTNVDAIAGWMLRLSNKDGYESVKHWFALANCYISQYLLTHSNLLEGHLVSDYELANDNASNSPANVTFRLMRPAKAA